MKKNKLFLLLLVGALSAQSPQTMAAPFFEDCFNIAKNIVGIRSKPVDPKNFKTPHPSFTALLQDPRMANIPEGRFVYLPELEQSLEEFKNTGVPYIKYYYSAKAPSSAGMDDFLEKTFEIVYTPHSSRFGHVRLRLGKKIYGFENVQRTLNSTFEPDMLFKVERAIKNAPGRTAKKEGNVGVVFTLTPEDKALLQERLPMINEFYNSSMKYNIPPFDGGGAKEVKLIIDEHGTITYKSPTAKSNFGNFKTAQGKIEKIGDEEFLVSPSGFKLPIKLNDKGERVVESFSCASSVNYVIERILGKKIIDKAYAESFMTHLKNGAEGYQTPDAVIHYYPSTDRD